MSINLIFALYLVLVWPALWLVLVAYNARYGFPFILAASLASLGGFLLGVTVLYRTIPLSVTLNLKPTALQTQLGRLFDVSLSSSLTFWHYLLLALPWIVVGLVAIRLLIGFMFLSVRLRGFDRAPRHLQDRLDRLAAKVGLSGVRLYIGKPGSLAFSGTRAVYISRDVLEMLSDDKLDAVLSHELAHIKRFDLPSKWLWVMMSSLAIVLPGVLFQSRFHLEVEKAADQVALTMTPSPIVLAEALISYAKMAKPTYLASNLGSIDQLTERTMCLLYPKTRKPNKVLAGLVLALIMTLSPSFLMGQTAAAHLTDNLSSDVVTRITRGEVYALVSAEGTDSSSSKVALIEKDDIQIVPTYIKCRYYGHQFKLKKGQL